MKFINLDREYSEFDWQKAISSVFASQHFINGPEVHLFEMAVAKYLEVNYALGVSSGTDAILISVMALKKIKGIENPVVLTTPYTFISTVESPMRANASIIFCDIDSSFNINMENVKNILYSTHVDIFLPVHLFGKAVELDEELLSICRKKGIFIIEDCAQCFGARDLKNRMSGSVGDIGCFSFFPAKNIGCAGDGGLVTTNNLEIFELMKSIRSHGSRVKYEYEDMGGNFRLDTIQAAILYAKLPLLNKHLKQRQEQAKRYHAGLLDLSRCYPITLPYAPNHTYNQYVILVPSEDRNPLVKYLSSKNVPTMNYFPFSILDTKFAKKYGLVGDASRSASAAQQNIALPIAYPTEEETELVVNSICEYFENGIRDRS